MSAPRVSHITHFSDESAHGRPRAPGLRRAVKRPCQKKLSEGG